MAFVRRELRVKSLIPIDRVGNEARRAFQEKNGRNGSFVVITEFGMDRREGGGPQVEARFC